MKYIDNILNQITMYRLVLYYLIILIASAFVLSIFNILPYNPVYLGVSTLFLVCVSYITNNVFSHVFEAPTNVESVYISALILSLIITPATSFNDLIFLAWAGVLTMASKYIFAVNKKHLFNPVAIGVLMTALVIGKSASWWVGNASLMPLVLIGGLLIVRKIQREALVFTYAAAAIGTILIFTIINGGDVVLTLQRIFLHSSLIFFASIMITEPLTTPPTRNLQIIYGGIVGFLFAPQIHVGSLYSTPEIALVLGNIYSYFVSPKYKLVLTLLHKIKLSEDTYDFVFKTNETVRFIPGQYMEWTLPHPKTDSRGNRRYFTLASSPTEKDLIIGVKFHLQGSSYKNEMLQMNDKTKIVASGLAGNFTLPKDKSKKLTFIAGGIGITPYRSMIKYLTDMGEKRDVILLYSNKHLDEICYKDVFEEAREKLGIKTVYALTDAEKIPDNWNGLVGRIDEESIIKEIPDYMERMFYLSGPRSMVTFYEETLSKMGVSDSNIKTDFFPGFV